jgi:thiamine kinase-like enzyme
MAIVAIIIVNMSVITGFLMPVTRKIMLLDYEYASMNDEFYDLGI